MLSPNNHQLTHLVVKTKWEHIHFNGKQISLATIWWLSEMENTPSVPLFPLAPCSFHGHYPISSAFIKANEFHSHFRG